MRDDFVEFKYRLKNENEENIIRYLKKVDGNKYKFNNIVQCSYIDYLVEKLSKIMNSFTIRNAIIVIGKKIIILLNMLLTHTENIIMNISKTDIYKKYLPKDYKMAKN